MDFFKLYLINGYVYIQLLPVLIGFIVWKHLDKPYRLFVIVLLYSALNESFKTYYGTYIVKNQNKILSNLYNIIYFSFLFWLFCKKVNSNVLKKIISIIVTLYFISIGYELFYKGMDYHNQTQVIPFIIGGFGILVCVFYYFVSLLNSKEIISIHRNLLFWIAIAHFIYYLGFTPFKIGENYYASFDKYYYLFDVKVPITFFKCIILSIGFICSRLKIQ
ncbi:hypothetical protein [Polaribacter butkevichii]|uniref:Uncharacterized protein n=1 Tax=Polaribacter butkevichii TaxID=218490 RepID=A0A2P6CAC6_9FLAO|nr:hypothetical protein [Polaribacter butkevichii]PQJ71788.1 hypothetical protein BTO14_00310 [Polaribacter butkevichii]